MSKTKVIILAEFNIVVKFDIKPLMHNSTSDELITVLVTEIVDNSEAPNTNE